jgi:hypothetical protein
VAGLELLLGEGGKCGQGGDEGEDGSGFWSHDSGLAGLGIP